jgi:hypothetical protein
MSSKNAQAIRARLVTEAEAPIRCFYCEREVHPDLVTVDHVVPLARGGKNRIENAVLACARCNNAKGPLTAEEFMRVRSNPVLLTATRLNWELRISRKNSGGTVAARVSQRALERRMANRLGYTIAEAWPAPPRPDREEMIDRAVQTIAEHGAAWGEVKGYSQLELAPDVRASLREIVAIVVDALTCAEVPS